MNFISTRGGGSAVSFREAVFRGLAPDGGLYHPDTVPDLTDTLLSFSADTPFAELAREITHRLLAPEITEEQAAGISRKAFRFAPKLREMDDGLTLLELYHGPSYAFKDFGACFLASCMEEFLKEARQTAVILVATSGDTGSAVARAFHKKENIQVVILYPSGRVSLLQEKQLTTLGDNVAALEVQGSFDDCQRMAKAAFRDPELSRKLTLTSANSINLGRLVPQSFYYVYAYAQIARKLDARGNGGRARGPVFCVPSGNFGNLTAGVYAWQWGLPVKRFIAATNANDVVPEYLRDGTYRPRASVRTLSNAMDVGDPSNMERLQAVFDGDVDRMRALLHGEAVSDEETLRAIGELYESQGRYVDPHTAVGYVAARRLRDGGEQPNEPIVILSTAHPAKFRETVVRATGTEPELPEGLQEAMGLPKRSTVIDGELESLRGFLLEHYG